MTRDIFKDCDLNTAQQAFNRLAAEPASQPKGKPLSPAAKLPPQAQSVTATEF